MSRILALFGILIIIMAYTAAGWVALYPPQAMFAPGATDIKVSRLGWNEWQISYRAPGKPTTWYSDVSHQLEAQGWGSLDRAEYGALSRTYSRASPLGPCALWEWSFLTFAPLRPRNARITVRRWFAVPWWRHAPT